MSVKKGLTLEEHQEIGRKLSMIHNELCHISVKVGNSYPKTSKVGKLAHKVFSGFGNKDLINFRCELDSELYKEHREQANTQVYYGPEGRDGIPSVPMCPDCGKEIVVIHLTDEGSGNGESLRPAWACGCWYPRNDL